ncbi:Bcr/CflA family multidrug efflux MFS transporter [Gandjariella thermophila]|uniref:Bcr/CflA family drug resistance efflux transporter n=1 Tax=Gandjariella thermophila TaxID=1931992 RepID=A0A4D4JIL5_9PSEU|nr:Bcr/CflA family multidrug efflux MFS transporter [Gandjariella thermophila]GDY33733.1 Bcr/CflA family drug resistance efflux transporter [Gandjariella thermophila]
MSASPREESRWRRLRRVLILGGLTAFGPLSIDMYLPALPALARGYGAAESEVQLTLTACVLGIAVGQVLAGPLSDTLGRRRPLLAGLLLYTAVSLLCAVAPSVPALTALRLLQGLGAAAGIVIARAVVRDLHSGAAAARYFSMLMLVAGAAPILAPVIGGQLLRLTSWRGVFVVLGLFGAVLLLAAGLGLAETLPAERRRSGELGDTLRTFGRLLTDRVFLGYALASGLAFAAMFSYISGSPFVLQQLFGLSPQAFSLVFAVNSVGIMVCGQVNGRLVGRIGPARLLVCGLVASSVGGLTLLAVTAAGLGLPAILPPLFVVVASIGFVMPNSTALALSDYPRAAGSASALLGVAQFIVGAVAAPLVGLGEASALPMALVIACLGALALSAFFSLTRSRRSAATSVNADHDLARASAGE